MRLTEFQQNLRIELGDTDPDDQDWTDDELGRAIDSAIHDMDRFLPLSKIYEVTIKSAITGESWTSGSAHGTYVSLAHSMIKPSSEVVTNVAGTTTYARDTDYTINYSSGQITTISGGAMAASTGYKVSYTRSKIAIDLSSLTDLIRVTSVESPMGMVPQTFVGFQVTGSILFINTTGVGATRSQTELADGAHVAIHYDAINTAPSESAEPSFPRHLDEVVLRGALAHCFLVMSAKQDKLVKDDMENARTQIVDISTVLTAAEAALAHVATHITESDTALDKVSTHEALAKTALDKVAGKVIDAAGALTNADDAGDDAKTALSTVNLQLTNAYTALGKVDSKVSNAETALGAVATDTGLASTALAKIPLEVTNLKMDVTALVGVWNDLQNPYMVLALSQLNSGVGLINKVNVGSDPAEEYRKYGALEVDMVNVSGQHRIQALVSSIGAFSELITGFVNEASQCIGKANARVAEGSQRVAIIDAYIGEAAQYISGAGAWISRGSAEVAVGNLFLGLSAQYLASADSYVGEANSRYAACDRYLNEASGRLQMAQTYVGEAQTLLSEIQWKLAASQQYGQLAAQAIEVAKNFRTEGDGLRTEYYSILRDRQQWITEKVAVSRNQLRGG